jgi:hypothetical protein
VTIDLILIGLGPRRSVGWNAGQILDGGSTLAALLAALANTRGDAVLCWDHRASVPDLDTCRALLAGRGDLWHAGLALGTGGQPGMIDFVAPNWMLNCDASADIESTSWRITFAGCLLRRSVLEQIGLPCADFETVEGAALEWGHRALSHGVLMRHIPSLATDRTFRAAPPSLADEVRFVAYRYGRSWARWAIARAGMTGYASPLAMIRAYGRLPGTRPYRDPPPHMRDHSLGEPPAGARVTVLIPTLDRYKYLHVVLAQLRVQTVQPCEIIIIDQTRSDTRDTTIAAKFSDLPLRLMYQDEPGQCASRNAGLHVSTGDYVLFIDDDDEIPPDLIERHLRNLYRYDADVSSGVAQEIGTDALSRGEQYVRMSHVFPTNNTLARRSVLLRSGLFDLAFNRAPRADGDLGMRVYLSGAYMVLDQSISVLHHRAAVGGLRVHRARVITYRMSRELLTKRHLPHISEIYLTSRYFTPRQQREMLWLRTFGTLSGRGTRVQRFSKLVVGSVLLPDTVRQTMSREHAAREWRERFPQIPQLDG